MPGRRVVVLLVVLGAMAVPAAVLHAACVGKSCSSTGGDLARVPFCPLPDRLKDQLENGFYEGRSPDVLAVTAGTEVWTDAGGVGARARWPDLRSPVDTRVPIVLAGRGVAADARLPDGVTLDRIAPTVSEIVGLRRPHPEVRSGTSVEGVAAGERPRLFLLIAWKGVGTAELRDDRSAWPFLASLEDDGAGTLRGDAGSLPLDPTATLTTIGSGGLPRQHGVTGSFVRNDAGAVVDAFGPQAPVPVIASLGDDLDESTDQRSVISLVATSELDRGLIGGAWYPDHDRDAVAIAHGGGAVGAAHAMLGAPGMDDEVTDVLGVVLSGDVGRLDRWTERIVRDARAATDGSVLVVVAGTGSERREAGASGDAAILRAVDDAVPGVKPAVAAAVPGGLFLDQRVVAAAEVTGQVAVDALMAVTGDDGRRALADAFQGFAVSFARYC